MCFRRDEIVIFLGTLKVLGVSKSITFGVCFRRIDFSGCPNPPLDASAAATSPKRWTESRCFRRGDMQPAYLKHWTPVCVLGEFKFQVPPHPTVAYPRFLTRLKQRLRPDVLGMPKSKKMPVFRRVFVPKKMQRHACFRRICNQQIHPI